MQGISGFAFSMVAMSFWVWGLEPQLAAVLAVVGSLTGQLTAVGTARRRLDLHDLWPFLAGAGVGVPIGVAVLPLLGAEVFKLILGGVLAVWCPVMLFSRRLPHTTVGGRWADALAGAGGGFMGGLGGFTGVVPTLWCTLRGLDKDRQRAIVQNFNLATLAFTLAGYVASGAVSGRVLTLAPLLTAVVVPAAWLGTRLYRGMSAEVFRRFVLGLLSLAGLAMLASALPRLLG
ncbi:candidate membrane protein [Ramlibacter tataouinensis TTB310]|uniref:Probable membrane transporter protein n=1 Tax=Ramlibacter tataouinensis (strain ATCC BAA-407 / DSM 14655 / LMG 21543 / TTB310) TaxID=365046 RepID=F5Y0Z8_RAMTT|nr:candidate membrane protein [Ramlibacter tataouinensis TTB310]